MIVPLTAGYLAAFVAFAAARGDRRVLAYLVVWSILAAAITAVHRSWPLPRGVLAALSASGALHLAGGLLPSPDPGAAAPIFYETWLVPGLLKADQAIHAVISAVVTVAVFQLLGHFVDARASRSVRVVLSMLVCWGFGAANELFEFLSALRFTDAYVGDLGNAGWDLAFNVVGSLAAALWLVGEAGSQSWPVSSPGSSKASSRDGSSGATTAASRS
ncbi:MAG: hypothetical protein ACRD0U_09830 [Acidimicrobiales bacterium]